MSASRAIPKPADNAQWLDLRRPYIGASEVLAVVDRHPFLTRGELATRKLTRTDGPQTKAMRRGLTLEDGVGLLWDEENHITTQRGPFMATPDRVPVEPDPPTWGVEIKTTALYITQPLESWVAQAYIQAYCADWSRVELGVLDATMSLKCYSVDCTTDHYHATIEELEEASERFNASIRDDIVPDEKMVKALFPRSNHVEVALDDTGLKWVQELADARELKHAGEDREKAAKDSIAGLLVDADTATYKGTPVLSWRNSRDGLRVDWSQLEADNPDLVEKYRRPTPGARVMRVLKEGHEVTSSMPWERTEAVT
jgi:predicted phage-related endonuclease